MPTGHQNLATTGEAEDKIDPHRWKKLPLAEEASENNFNDAQYPKSKPLDRCNLLIKLSKWTKNKRRLYFEVV